MKKNMSEEVEFLNYIYKNAKMGIVGIDSVLTKATDEKFEKLLIKQKDEYDSICKEAYDILKKYGKEYEDVSALAKISTNIMSEMSLLKDDSIQNIAKMMVEGTTKGVVEIIEKLNAYNNTDVEITVLADRLKSMLENNIDELKKYL